PADGLTLKGGARSRRWHRAPERVGGRKPPQGARSIRASHLRASHPYCSTRRVVPVAAERLHEEHGGVGAADAYVDRRQPCRQRGVFSGYDLEIADDPAVVAQVRLLE